MSGKDHGIKERNERAVLRRLLVAGETGVTRPELAAQVGLSSAAIANLVTGRIAPIIETERIERQTRGRRPDLLRITRNAGCTLGVDFGQTYMGLGLYDLLGEELGRLYLDVGAGADATGALRWMKEQAEALVTDLPSLVGVGISIAAPVYAESPVLRHDMFSMPDWEGRDPAQELKAMLGWGCPFEVDNDANLAAIAEARWGAARGRSNAIFVKWTWGIGAGLILDGELRRSGGIAGEIGHLEVELDAGHRDEPPLECETCGSHCLQAVAAMPVLLADAGIASAGDRARLHPGVEELIGRIRKGDEAAKAALERACRYLGQTLGTAITLLNPEAVIIGGDLTAASYDLFAPLILESMHRHSTSSAFEDVSLFAGEQTGRASLLGAATRMLDEHLLDHLMEQADTRRDSG